MKIFNLPLRGTLTLEDSLTLRYREQPSTFQPATYFQDKVYVSQR